MRRSSTDHLPPFEHNHHKCQKRGRFLALVAGEIKSVDRVASPVDDGLGLGRRDLAGRLSTHLGLPGIGIEAREHRGRHLAWQHGELDDDVLLEEHEPDVGAGVVEDVGRRCEEQVAVADVVEVVGALEEAPLVGATTIRTTTPLAPSCRPKWLSMASTLTPALAKMRPS